MRRSRTRLEGLLFWWLLANLFLVATVTVLAVTLPSDLVKITAAGSSRTLGLIGLILVVGFWVYLTWKMRAPSSCTLLFGALFFLFAVLHLEGRGWLWSLNPVLAFRAALVNRP